jgi:hypothetical protein
MLISGLRVHVCSQALQWREARWHTRVSRAECRWSSAGKSYPHVAGGAFFSRHGVWLIFSVEEAGAGEMNCGKRYFSWYSPRLSAQAGTMKAILTSQISQVTCNYRAACGHGLCPGSSASASLLKSLLCKLNCNQVCPLTLYPEAIQPRAVFFFPLSLCQT